MRRTTTTLAAALAVALLVPEARAQEGEGDQKAAAGSGVPEGHVLTFYGLRKLEHDEDVSDEEKLKEWEAYIERTRQNLDYAKKAVQRWKNAAKMRVIDSVQKDDRDPTMRPRDKMKKWERIVSLYPKSGEARLAKKRIAFWRTIETKLLVEAAEEVERDNASKVERIRAWRSVTEWVSRGSEARAAERRIAALQKQLFQEAQSLDRIARVDAATKLASWRDVLAGAPTGSQRKTAEKRIRELSAQTRAK